MPRTHYHAAMQAKRWITAILVAIAAIAMLLHGPIPQPLHYHEFATTSAGKSQESCERCVSV